MAASLQAAGTCRMGVMPVPPAIMDQCVAVCSCSPSRNLRSQVSRSVNQILRRPRCSAPGKHVQDAKYTQVKPAT
jgi:hypothetical protein